MFFPVLWAIVIALLIFMPGREMPQTDIWDLLAFDTFSHVLVFALFAFLLIGAFLKQYTYGALRSNAKTYAMAISVAYGLLAEASHWIIPGRLFEWPDLVANCAGSLLGYLLFRLLYKF